MNVRAVAANVLYQVIDKGQSLTSCLPQAQQDLPPRDRGLLQELCYGVLRWLPRLEAISRQLVNKPLTGKVRPIHFLILVGLYQLAYLRVPAHAAVAETVNGVKPLKAPALRGLLNAVLRNFQRNQEALLEQADASEPCRLAHPSWLIKRLQQHYPDQWQQILEQNNQYPPMWIRINRQHGDRQQFLARLAEQQLAVQADTPLESAVCLASPCDVQRLPGFAEGHCSVQDAAAQHAALLLDLAPGQRVLDACAAPGGKTAHILEQQPDLAQLVALDVDPGRLKRIQQNLERIGVHVGSTGALLLQGDASEPACWWQGPQFDRILLDAPCSATGVIRRHPDIKWLRRDSDIDTLTALQGRILDAMWSLLVPGGIMLYATCSVLPEENREQVQAFLARNPDAELLPLTQQDDPTDVGWQILPGTQNMDGFYYAKLRKL